MLLKEFVEKSRDELGKIYPVQEAGTITGMLCTELLDVQIYTHIVEPELELSAATEAKALSALERLSGGEPVQYVLGYSFFCGHKFNVNSSVLIPRPETEQLCEEAVNAATMLCRDRKARCGGEGPVRILDMCTGSGCIAWTLAGRIPDAEIVAVDISREALDVASSQPLEVKRKPSFVIADIFDVEAVNALSGGGFDIIVSNPPYIMESEKEAMRANVLDFEPGLALFVPDDNPLLYYAALADICKKHIHAGGVGYFEINERLGGQVADLFRSRGLENVAVMNDQFGRNRFLKCIR